MISKRKKKKQMFILNKKSIKTAYISVVGRKNTIEIINDRWYLGGSSIFGGIYEFNGKYWEEINDR